MINLNNIEHFAQGGNRRCFIHPLKKDRCLKVSFEGQSEKVKKNAAWYKKLRLLLSKGKVILIGD